MLEFTCDSVVAGNADFGPPTAGKPNYVLMIGSCPGNCHEKGDHKVFGMGIHPEMSSICKAAIYDRSMPISGGVIGVGIQPGIGQYSKGQKVLGLVAGKHGPAPKSFYTLRIDNFDMAENDMRIIDF